MAVTANPSPVGYSAAPLEADMKRIAFLGVLALALLATGCPGGGDDDGPCEPVTCEEAGKDCGYMDDGCGERIACGTCPSHQTCGAGGSPNVCGSGTCTVTTCEAAGKDCGMISDGCADVLACGSCADGEVCGGGGAPNVCGTGECTRVTCAEVGAECGLISDGCGGSRSCGSCEGNLSCGGAGVENVCGAPCALGCPDGYACSVAGVCTGGDPTGLLLDVATHRLTGRLTHNGATPTDAEGCANSPDSNKAIVQLYEQTRGYNIQIPIRCASGTYSFDGTVYPGTYRVQVWGTDPYWTTLPQAPYLAREELIIEGDESGIVFDVATHRLTGRLTHNGATPTDAEGCANSPDSNKAIVQLFDQGRGYNIQLPIRCASGTYSFDGTVYPGTYRVQVWGTDPYWTTLPQAPYVARDALAIDGDESGLVFDVATHRVTGRLTHNGATPTDAAGCANSPDSNKAIVRFYEQTLGYNIQIPVRCASGTYSFDGTVYPGTYQVSVWGTDPYWTELPEAAFRARDALSISGDESGLVFDVATHRVTGRLTHNGATPTDAEGCANSPDSTKAIVQFHEQDRGYHFQIPVRCASGTYSFDADVYPGTYRVSVWGTDPYWTTLPQAAYRARDALSISGDESGLVFDVATHRVTGRLTQNGATPTDAEGCANSPESAKAIVQFFEQERGYNFQISVRCASGTYSFDANVYPGTYRVSVWGTDPYWTTLPEAAYVSRDALAISGAESGLVFDVATYPVGGTITHDGAVPADAEGCANSPDSAKAVVQLYEIGRGYNFQLRVPCNAATYAFGGEVYPGTYRVSVWGTDPYWTHLPQSPYVVISRIAIP
jgi:hypothetical protein